jgi:hypothetical protein
MQSARGHFVPAYQRNHILAQRTCRARVTGTKSLGDDLRKLGYMWTLDEFADEEDRKGKASQADAEG